MRGVVRRLQLQAMVEGCPVRLAPGFPDDGSWVVKSEGLSKAP